MLAGPPGASVPPTGETALSHGLVLATRPGQRANYAGVRHDIGLTHDIERPACSAAGREAGCGQDAESVQLAPGH